MHNKKGILVSNFQYFNIDLPSFGKHYFVSSAAFPVDPSLVLSHPTLRIKLDVLNSCVPRDQSHTQADKL